MTLSVIPFWVIPMTTYSLRGLLWYRSKRPYPTSHMETEPGKPARLAFCSISLVLAASATSHDQAWTVAEDEDKASTMLVCSRFDHHCLKLEPHTATTVSRNERVARRSGLRSGILKTPVAGQQLVCIRFTTLFLLAVAQNVRTVGMRQLCFSQPSVG